MLNPEADREFQAAARALAERPRKPVAKAVARAFELDSEEYESLEVDPELFVTAEAEDDENDEFIRDISSTGYGPTAAFDPQLSFYLPLHDLGDGEADIRVYGGPMAGSSGTFARATVATCRLKNGLLKKVASGVPRSHYSADGTYLGYQAEVQRTNLLPRSEEADNATWSKTNTTVQGDVTTAPDGTLTADKITETSATGVQHYISQAVTYTAAIHTFSAFLKYGSGRERATLNIFDGTTSYSANFNLQTGVVINTTGNATGTIEAWSDGWYRCTVTPTAAVAAAVGNAAVIMRDSSGASIYDGDGTSYIYVWGAQLEQAAFVSSYIPTTTAAVTRNKDSLLYGISALSMVEGTAYAEVTSQENFSGGGTIAFIAGSTSSRIIESAGTSACRIVDASSNFAVSSLTLSALNKVASSWGPAGLRIADGGAAPGTGTFASMSSGDPLGIGNYGNTGGTINGTIRNVRLWRRHMPDAQLSALTA